MPHKIFDRSRLKLRPLAERQSDLTRDIFITPDSPFERCEQPALPVLAERIREARIKGNAVILMLGAHVIRRGAAPLLIDLMKRGLVTHIALNGAGAIHDYELALIGQTSESVARYVSTGEFGLWTETGGINLAAKAGTRRDRPGRGHRPDDRRRRFPVCRDEPAGGRVPARIPGNRPRGDRPGHRP